MKKISTASNTPTLPKIFKMLCISFSSCAESIAFFEKNKKKNSPAINLPR
jgi:hypothetical protein